MINRSSKPTNIEEPQSTAASADQQSAQTRPTAQLSSTLSSDETSLPKSDQSLVPASDWNYEATVQKLAAIMTRIESGELELSQVFEQFAEAVTYLQQCESFLTQHQQQMDLLIETLTDEMDF